MFILETQIADSTVDLLNTYLDLQIKNKNRALVKHTIKGFQTPNLMEDPVLDPVLEDLLSYIPTEYGRLGYYWFHMIDYKTSGSQSQHNHSDTERYSFIVYLSDCEMGGETVFLHSGKTIKITPKQGTMIFFPAELEHYGATTVSRKRVAVGALI
jgi:hypothetical protein